MRRSKLTADERRWGAAESLSTGLLTTPGREKVEILPTSVRIQAPASSVHGLSADLHLRSSAVKITSIANEASAAAGEQLTASDRRGGDQ